MIIVSLFDESGNALRPWAEAGCQCYAFDLENDDRWEFFPNGGAIYFAKANLLDPVWVARIIELKPAFVMGFPPCTDLAVSGARHFEKKRLANPRFQYEAVALCRVVEDVGEACGVPWFAENPISMLSTLWRSPDYYWHPYQYGGYLPENDIHPRWPQYIAPRDGYEKLSCFWTSKSFTMPETKPVSFTRVVYDNGVSGSTQFSQLGGKSKKTKQIRSETPRGLSRALFEHYWRILNERNNSYRK